MAPKENASHCTRSSTGGVTHGRVPTKVPDAVYPLSPTRAERLRVFWDKNDGELQEHMNRFVSICITLCNSKRDKTPDEHRMWKAVVEGRIKFNDQFIAMMRERGYEKVEKLVRANNQYKEALAEAEALEDEAE